MRTRLYFVVMGLLVALIAGKAFILDARAGSASSQPSVGLVFRHVYSQHARLCDSPTGAVTWTGNNARQRFQHCTLKAREVVITPMPAPTRTAFVQTPAPRPTVTPWPTPQPTLRPTATAAIPPGCSDANLDACLLALINGERTSHGLPPLILDATMSNGTGTCIGAIGHARNMAAAGTIGHWDFPGDVCGYGTRFFHIGENVGAAASSGPVADVELVNSLMLGEQYPCPTGTSNHHCQIDDPGVRYVGLGIVAGAYLGRPGEYISEEFGGP